MHKEILTESQIKLLPLVKTFKQDFYLVGGTAIALYIGHRRSYENPEQLHITVEGVKVTFFHYPFEIPPCQ